MYFDLRSFERIRFGVCLRLSPLKAYVTPVSRSERKLQEAAKQIDASTGVAAKWIVADLSEAADR